MPPIPTTTQNPTVCGVLLHVCRLRATRLLATGAVAPGPHNSYVSDALIDFSYNPVILAGEDRDLQSGCNCLLATFRNSDKHKRFDLALHDGTLQPALLEMLTGAPLLTDTSTIPVPIGNSFPTPANVVGCATPSARTGLELWAELIDGDAPSASFPYVRLVFPMTEWRWDNATLQNDFQTTALAGFTRGNTLFGDPYGDMPFGRSVGAGGGMIFDPGPLPTASCGYSAASAS